jgi:chromosome segregation ATPase
MNENFKTDLDNPNNKNKEDIVDDENSSIEKMEKELSDKAYEIIQLQTKIADLQDRIHDVIIEKGSIEKQLNTFKLTEISLQFGKFEKLKIDYEKLVHRLEITKKQLDDARKCIESQNQFVENANKRLEFMDEVIEDLAHRGLIDFIRNRFPESFTSYKNNRKF